jgi:predicted nucleic acid-binding protein
MSWVVDTSVWFHVLGTERSPKIAERLNLLISDDEALMHNVVLAEISMGKLANRATILAGLGALPKVFFDWDMFFQDLETYSVYTLQPKFNDTAIVLSAKRAGAGIWSRDEKLKRIAVRLNVKILDESQSGQ